MILNFKLDSLCLDYPRDSIVNLLAHSETLYADAKELVKIKTPCGYLSKVSDYKIDNFKFFDNISGNRYVGYGVWANGPGTLIMDKAEIIS